MLPSHSKDTWTAFNIEHKETFFKNIFVKCKKLYLFLYPKTKLNLLLAQTPRFVLVINNGGLTLNSTEVLEINTTAPSVNVVNCSTGCNYNASHENRSSSGHTVPIAVIKFTRDIVFTNGSVIKVFGDYALSITSLHGSIDIQTDINMPCGEMRLNTICLGGFTQSAAGTLVGLRSPRLLYQGKGSVLISCFLFQLCLFWMYISGHL